MDLFIHDFHILNAGAEIMTRKVWIELSGIKPRQNKTRGSCVHNSWNLLHFTFHNSNLCETIYRIYRFFKGLEHCR